MAEDILGGGTEVFLLKIQHQISCGSSLTPVIHKYFKLARIQEAEAAPEERAERLAGRVRINIIGVAISTHFNKMLLV